MIFMATIVHIILLGIVTFAVPVQSRILEQLVHKQQEKFLRYPLIPFTVDIQNSANSRDLQRVLSVVLSVGETNWFAPPSDDDNDVKYKLANPSDFLQYLDPFLVRDFSFGYTGRVCISRSQWQGHVEVQIYHEAVYLLQSSIDVDKTCTPDIARIIGIPTHDTFIFTDARVKFNAWHVGEPDPFPYVRRIVNPPPSDQDITRPPPPPPPEPVHPGTPNRPLSQLPIALNKMISHSANSPIFNRIGQAVFQCYRRPFADIVNVTDTEENYTNLFGPDRTSRPLVLRLRRFGNQWSRLREDPIPSQLDVVHLGPLQEWVVAKVVDASEQEMNPSSVDQGAFLNILFQIPLVMACNSVPLFVTSKERLSVFLHNIQSVPLPPGEAADQIVLSVRWVVKPIEHANAPQDADPGRADLLAISRLKYSLVIFNDEPGPYQGVNKIKTSSELYPWREVVSIRIDHPGEGLVPLRFAVFFAHIPLNLLATLIRTHNLQAVVENAPAQQPAGPGTLSR